MFGGSRDHALEEGAAVGGVGLAIERLHVDQNGAGMRRVGRDRERGRIGYEANFPDRAHAIDGRQVVEHGKGLHRQGQTDARLEAVVEAGHSRALTANDAVVVAVKEAHEAEAGRLRLRENLLPFDVEVDAGRAVGDRGRHQITLSWPGRNPWLPRRRGGRCSTRGDRR